MPNLKFLLFGTGFFILAIVLLGLYEPAPPLLSITQSTRCRDPYLDDGFIKGIVMVQEVTVKKDYLNGFAIRYITMDRENTNSNTIVVFDQNDNLIFQEKFASKDVKNRKFRDFRFNESKKIGKGNKISICFMSPDGDSANCVHSLFNKESKLGDLYVCAMVNNDLFTSLKGKKYPYPGALFLRTYESENSMTTSIRYILYLVALLVALVIAFFRRVQQFLVRISIWPEYVYVIFSLVFGLLFTFVTPPGQAPDEGGHMARIAELSEFQFKADHKTVPAAFVELDSTFARLKANPDERTSKAEILSSKALKTDPAKRAPSNGPDYIIPYLPQLLGLFTAKIFSSSPLVIGYFGRIFNLLCSILLIYLAIRITPIGKWILLLLALMPKTLFLMASLSYDSFVISLSFLTIATFLHYAFKYDRALRLKDYGLLLFLCILLVFCKPPYFLLGALFFFIPFLKTRPWSKYLLLSVAVVASILLIYGIWSLTKGSGHPSGPQKTEQVAMQNQSGISVTDSISQAPVKPEINPQKQLGFMRSHPATYINLLYATNFADMRADILNNFVGTMGWLDTFLPDNLINLYLILLIVAALCIAEVAVPFDWRRKLFLFLLFIAGVLAIETAMYVYASFVAQEKLFGIQGRYFIPLAPLFLLIFYNNTISRKLNYLFSARRNAYAKAKPGQKPKILIEIDQEQIFSKFLQVLITGFTFVALARGVAAVLLRYYQW